MAELPPGAVVAGCRVEAVVGRGGMGVVYRATQLSLERSVALKAIAPELAGDATFRERFKRESRIAASIEHPNVIPVYEAGEGEGLLYLIMRYVEGTDLRASIDASRRLDPARATRVVAQVAAALAAAHRRDLIHRDVKPANVLIDAGGDEEHAYLTDFGIARHAAATSGLTRTGAVIGTLDYLAPERILDESGDGRSDVYSLGCVLFEALTGAIPYERDNDVAKMYAHLNAPVPSVRELAPDVPAELDELTRRAMAKQPDERFESASAMAEALASALPARAPHRPPAAAAAPTRPASAPPAERARAEPPDGPATPADAEPARPGFSEEAALEVATAEELSPAERRAEPRAVAERASVDERRAPTRRRAVLVTVLAGAVAAGAVLVVILLSGGDPDDGGPAPSGGPTQEPAPEEPLAFSRAGVARLAPGPDGMAADSERVWIANKDTNEVVPVDQDSAQAGDPIAVGEEPDSVAIGFGSVWVTNTSSDSVTRIDPDTGQTGEPIPVGREPEGIAVSDTAVWVANGTGNSVTRIPRGGGKPSTAPVGQGPVQIAVTDDDRVWVTLSKEDRVVELDSESGERTGTPVNVPGEPRGIASDGERLWVSATSGNRIVVFDPDTRRVRRATDLDDPREVRFGLGAIWVSSGSQGSVTAINPGTKKPIDRFDVGELTYGVAVGSRFAWAASERTGRLVKIAPG